MKRDFLKHIILIAILLSVSKLLFSQGYQVDEVCVDEIRNYRIDGEENSIYAWTLINTNGDTILLPYQGEQIEMNWDVPAGKYYISVTQYAENGCSAPKELGYVWVNPNPYITGESEVFVGSDIVLDATETAAYNEAWASSDPTIAWVNQDGLVHGVSEGSVTITYTTDKGCFTTHLINVISGNCNYWIGNCQICACYDNYPAQFTLYAGTNGATYCPPDNSGEWSFIQYTGLEDENAIPEFADPTLYETEVMIPYPGIYRLRYTWPGGNYVESDHKFVEQPNPQIIGEEVANTCEEAIYSVHDGRLLHNEPLSYQWYVSGGNIIGSDNEEQVTIQWDSELGVGTVSIVTTYNHQNIGCEGSDVFTVQKQYPTLAGQVKYWNEYETYMPSPYLTEDYGTYPQDYFYVTLYHENGNTLDSIQTVKVENRLEEDLNELLSYFEFDIDAHEFGCDAQFVLRVWDGGLIYHQNLPPIANTHLGANYTYNNVGGINATDALAVQLMVGGAININAMPYNYQWVGLNTDIPSYGFYSHSIADVNSSNPYSNGGITALDALTIKYRTVGLIANYPDNSSENEFSPNYRVAGRLVPKLPYNTYPKPFDWDNEDDVDFRHNGREYEYFVDAKDHFYESESISWFHINKNYINIYYNVSGDINGSYVPPSDLENTLRNNSQVRLFYDETIEANVGDIINIPIRIGQSEKLGAITLGLNYRNDLIEIIGTNYDEDSYLIDEENGLINIAWYDTNGRYFNKDESIAVIQVRLKEHIEDNVVLFSLKSNSELANPKAEIIGSSILYSHYINTHHYENNIIVNPYLAATNYPNPFKDYTTIEYTLPDSGEVDISVYDATGRLISHLINAYQPAGVHTIRFDNPTNLYSGVFIYKVVLAGNSGVRAVTGKMTVDKTRKH